MAIRITRAGVALTVGIIVVTGLIIGGLFLVKNQGEQARRDEAIKVAERNLEGQSNEGVALNEGEGTNEQTQGEESTQGGTEVAPSTETETATGSEQTSGSSEVAGQATVNELPTTGPADVAAFMALGLLTFAAVSYYRSRQVLLKSGL